MQRRRVVHIVNTEPLEEHDMTQAIHTRQPHGAFVDIADLVSLVERARSQMVAALDELVVKLAAASSTDADVDFGGLVNAAQRLLAMDDGEMARMLKVSRPTIGRWIRGSSSPHPLGRGAIFDALSGQARIRMKNLRG